MLEAYLSRRDLRNAIHPEHLGLEDSILSSSSTCSTCIAVLPFIPESPRWLAYKDRTDDALEVLAVAHGLGDKNDPVVLTEYQEIVQTLAFEKQAGSVSPLESFRTPGNRYRMVLMLSCAIFSMTAANNIVTCYLGTMLKEAGTTNTNTQLVRGSVLQGMILL